MNAERHRLSWPGGEIRLDRCAVMGVLNLTPDSFSDGGQFPSTEAAVERAWEIAREGARILDVGGESTRPGSEGVDAEVERARVFPLLERLKAEAYPLPISLDTTKPDVAAQALDEGLARIVNDVRGLRDPAMREVVRKRGAPVVLMHMWGTPRTMQQECRYEDVVADLIRFFRERIRECGITGNCLIDPGIGFGKSVAENLAILKRLREFHVVGFPILVGASRKSFIGRILEAEVDDRLEGSLVAAAAAVLGGAAVVRAHDVRATARAVKLAEAIGRGGMELPHERFFSDPAAPSP